MATSIPILDSHIHLCPASELSSLAWYEPDHALGRKGAFSVVEYRASTTASPSDPAATPAPVRGFVFVEADRKTDSTAPFSPAATDAALAARWAGALAEVAFAQRLVAGRCTAEEGVRTAGRGADKDAAMVAAVVPWAPVADGVEAVKRYVRLARKAAAEARKGGEDEDGEDEEDEDDEEDDGATDVWLRVKGFRYLVQDKPAGVMLKQDFVDAVKYLARGGYAFDVGVDQHRRGRAQLDEMLEMIGRVRDEMDKEDEQRGGRKGKGPVFIINHLCKPDLTIYNTSDPSFVAWRAAMYALSRYPRVYMKLSGCFSELPDQLRKRDADAIFDAIQPWLAVALATFGPKRLMFASDWPVCTAGVDEDAEPEEQGGEEEAKGKEGDEAKAKDDGQPKPAPAYEKSAAWKKWLEVVRRMCSLASLSVDDQRRIFLGTAVEAYDVGREVDPDPGYEDWGEEDEGEETK